MTTLIIGVLLWTIVHLIPTLGQSSRKELVGRLGEKGYRGIFALLIFASLGFIIAGWRSTPEQFLYVLPVWARTLGFVLMIVAFLLIGAAQYPTRIKQFVRHPMLLGVAVWSISHLLVNGTTRALILFGGLGVWAILEILLINRREGPYEAPEAPSIGREIRGALISAVIFGVALYLHPYFAGVSPL
ncbi:MAG: NnrU family protein [Woeseiaceae bacterium]